MSVNASALDVFRVLRIVGISDDLLRATDISNRLDITHSITRRAIATLVQAGYLQRHQHWGRFEIGFAARQLANSLVNRFPIRQAAIPVLRELAFRFHGAASLNVRVGWYSIRLASIEGGASLFTHARKLGDPTLLGTTNTGRVMLAGLEAEEVERYFRFAAAMPATAFDKPEQSKLKKQLAQIREQGWVLKQQSANSELRAVSIALRNKAQRIVGGISVEGTAEHLPGENPERAMADLQKTIQAFEKLADASPEIFKSPFDHLDPDEIRFGLD